MKRTLKRSIAQRKVKTRVSAADSAPGVMGARQRRNPLWRLGVRKRLGLHDLVVRRQRQTPLPRYRRSYRPCYAVFSAIFKVLEKFVKWRWDVNVTIGITLQVHEFF